MADAKYSWSEEKTIVRQKDLRALQSAKEMEERKLSEGWRYIRIDGRSLVFVPCDEDGTPTKKGLAMIEKFKKIYKVK